MNFKNLLLLAVIYSLFFSYYCFGIEISLEGTEKGKTLSIACVDMEKLYKEYPKVEQSKKEYESLKKEKQTEIEEKEKEIKEIQDEIKKIEQEIEKAKTQTSQQVEPVITSTSPETSVLVSTETSSEKLLSTSTETLSEIVTLSTSTAVEQKIDISKLELDLQEKNKLLEEKKVECEELKKKTQIELKEFENSKTMAIMADLYKIIKELAEEENISIVVEKGNVLYGLPNIDITDKVIDRLRGK